MKLILVCFIYFAAQLSLAQNLSASKQKYSKYEFIIECPMNKCDIEGKILDTTRYISQIGSKFIVVYEEKDKCIIRFLLNTKKNKKTILDFKGENIDNYKYYLIKRAQLDFKTKSADFNEFNLAVGSVLTPLKLRFEPFSFNKDFTIGPTIGVRYLPHEFSKLSYSGLFGIGISSITLDNFNTSGFLTKNIETIAFTPSLGFMLEYSNSQIGVFFGFDFLSASNDASSKFIYNNKPWLSIGFGQAIFSNK